MKAKKHLRMLLICAIMASCLSVPSVASEVQTDVAPAAIQRATGRFSTTISAGKIKKLDTSFTLEKDESVTFNASYSSSSASVDFGLLDSNNVFHFINVTSGSINEKIKVDVRGTYTPAIRNNSSSSISVSGYIEY